MSNQWPDERSEKNSSPQKNSTQNQEKKKENIRNKTDAKFSAPCQIFRFSNVNLSMNIDGRKLNFTSK